MDEVMDDLCRHCGFKIRYVVGSKAVRTANGRWHYVCWVKHKEAIRAKEIADSQSSLGDYVPLD